jgi:hypothetical protein
MNSTGNDLQESVESYLRKVRGRLTGINDEDARDFIDELRSHIRDKMAASGRETSESVAHAIAELGSPEDLASEYMINYQFSRAHVTRSPLRILRSLFYWSGLSAAGFFVLLVSLTGYFFGLVFILCAVLKPIHPETGGIWLLRGATDDLEISFRLGFGSAPVGGKELLGWWIVPLGLAAGSGLQVLTTRFALWCVRRNRRRPLTSHVLQH